ncbi:MAG: ankyrin repeat domain-containing protein [Rhodocyclaceae bacterium]|nr:ankyrin repeat domain-containing protein [Rhodocyclaceae bacterium]
MKTILSGQLFALSVVALILSLSGCTSTPVSQAPGAVPTKFARFKALEAGPPLAMAPSVLRRLSFDADSRPSFDCAERATSIEDAICTDKELVALDREMTASFRYALRSELIAGRSLLLTFHQHWLQTRGRECKLPPSRLGDAALDPAQLSCLRQTYRSHVQALSGWPSPAPRTKTTAHPVSAYVNYRLVDDRDTALCSDMAQRFDSLLVSHGDADLKQFAGVSKIVGTHGEELTRTTGVVGGRSVAVELVDPGLYASYQIRAKTATVNGRRVIDEKSLARWIQEQKNAGGRFNSLSSQTADYAAIDVFHLRGRDFALVTEPWAYYSPAAKGEAAYAGLFEIVNEPAGSAVAPRCLYRLFLAPPVAGVSARLLAYTQLTQALDAMIGGSPTLVNSYSPSERLERSALREESLWTQLTLPLVAIDDANRPGRLLAMRRQHDAMMEAIFDWSERSAAAKQRYRELMPLFTPAHAELVALFEAGQGLSNVEAVGAADIVVMDTVAHFAENLRHEVDVHSQNATALASYTPRYVAAPLPGALEQGRQFSNLHSALINRSPPAVITDFVKYEFSDAARKRGRNRRSSSGETALMAAIEQPELVQQLLIAGANPNEANLFNYTPLMAAVAAGQLGVVEQLLNAGAEVAAATIPWDSVGAGWPDVELGAVSGRTALMIAASGGSAELLRLILQRNPPRSPLDSNGRTACNLLESNTIIARTEMSELRASICRSEPPKITAERVTVKPMTLGELLAAGATRLTRDEVVRMTAGSVVRGENPDGRGSYELKFTATGLIEGSSRLERGDVIPIKGYWKVDNDAVICGSSALVIEGMGRKITLPTLCTRFYQLGESRYAVKSDAIDTDMVRLVPASAAK